jgi:hypothetical protein
VSADWWDSVIPVITALIGGGAAYLVARLNKRGTAENALIDQLQEERVNDAKRIDVVETRLNASLQRERIRDNYIHQLRDHIVQEKPPPPPDWPDGLTR